MRAPYAVLIAFFLSILVLPSFAFGEEPDEEKVVSGYVSLAGKYDTNVDLASEKVSDNAFEDDEVEDAFITEVSGLILFSSPRVSSWQFEFELFGLTDLHIHSERYDDSWYMGRGNLFLGYNFGANTISLLNESRYFSEPDDTELDNFKNSATLVYKRVFTSLWQGRIGYENMVHLFPESTFFNYYVNGGFFELRNSWVPAFSTYYSYDFQYYLGSYNSSTRDPLSSPDAGLRHTGEIGFESFFARKNSLLGSYTFQVDDSSGQGVEQVGSFRGEDENLDVDAEFNFVKHKGTLLYSHRFNDRFTLSFYEEFIYKMFYERDSIITFKDKERSDHLFLSSVWFKARLVSELYAKTRYLFRMNQSSLNSEDFQDHIFYLGLEYRY